MGLKDDLVQAKKLGLIAAGAVPPINVDPGSPIDVEATAVAAAIVKFLTSVNFRITKLNAPIVLEDFSIPEQPVDVERKTITLDKMPIVKTIGQLAGPGGTLLATKLAAEIKSETDKLLLEGCTLQPLELSKIDGTGLDSTGYAYIGGDPETQDGFDIDSRDGQKLFTEVKLFVEETLGHI